MKEVFGSAYKEIKDQNNKTKRGRGAVHKAPIVVLASYDVIPIILQKRNRPNSFPRYFKMFHLEDLKRDSINETVFRYVKLSSHIKSDAYRGYNDLKHLIEENTAKVIPSKEGNVELP